MWSDRWFIYNATLLGRSGILDRLTVLKVSLEFSISMKATLLFPKPCYILAPAHSKEIVNCSFGWNYYIQSSHFFYGLNGEDEFTGQGLNMRNAKSLNPGLLSSWHHPPNGSFVYILPAGFYRIKELLANTTKRLFTSQGISNYSVSINPSNQAQQMADILKESLNIHGSFGLLKIRRRDRSHLLQCTEPEVVSETFFTFYRSLTYDERLIPWVVFGYVEDSYWGALAHKFFVSGSSLSASPPRIIFERDMFFGNKSLKSSFRDNYLLMMVIIQLLSTAHYSIGTYSHEGRNDNFCA